MHIRNSQLLLRHIIAVLELFIYFFKNITEDLIILIRQLGCIPFNFSAITILIEWGRFEEAEIGKENNIRYEQRNNKIRSCCYFEHLNCIIHIREFFFFLYQINLYLEFSSCCNMTVCITHLLINFAFIVQYFPSISLFIIYVPLVA